jgi:hypothetical protein
VLRWLLALLLAALALHRLAGALGHPKTAPKRKFPPDGPDERANSPAGEPLSPYAIEDADYEEL